MGDRAHFFDGQWAVGELGVCCFVGGAEAAFADLLYNAVAFIEDVLLDQQAGKGVADGAIGRDMQGAPTE